MTFISYAQNYEDVMLWRALKHVKNGFYVDVGAAWPDKDSVTKAFYENGWHGINIEPNPQHFVSLALHRPRDTNIKFAVADHVGRCVMNFIADTGLSTVIDEFADQHKSYGWTTNREEVPLTTLKTIMSENIQKDQPIHFMKVDVEGLEDAVLQGNDWKTYRPWIVVVEATLPMSQTESFDRWEPVLLNADYAFAYADGLNRFYVASEQNELLKAFKFPPNVFDGFLLHSQNQSELRAKQSEDRAHQAEVREALYKAQLIEIYESKLWKVSIPFRWTIRKTKRLCEDLLTFRVKTLIGKVIRKINYELKLRPSTHNKILSWSKRLGLYSWLRATSKKAKSYGHSARANAQRVPVETEDISPYSRKIYIDLTKAIERYKKRGH